MDSWYTCIACCHALFSRAHNILFIQLAATCRGARAHDILLVDSWYTRTACSDVPWYRHIIYYSWYTDMASCNVPYSRAHNILLIVYTYSRAHNILLMVYTYSMLPKMLRRAMWSGTLYTTRGIHVYIYCGAVGHIICYLWYTCTACCDELSGRQHNVVFVVYTYSMLRRAVQSGTYYSWYTRIACCDVPCSRAHKA